MQLSYSRNMDKALVGMDGENQEGIQKITMYNPDAALNFGRFIARKAATERTAQYPADANADIMGVSGRYLPTESNGQYPINSALDVTTKGPKWVEVEQDVTPDDTVFAVFGSGKARKDNGVVGQGAATAVAVPEARFALNSITGRDGVKIALVYLTLI